MKRPRSWPILRVTLGQENLRARANNEENGTGEVSPESERLAGMNSHGRSLGPIVTHLFRIVLAMRVVRITMRRTSSYIDPGSGSMLVQVLLGGVAGVAVIARLFWYRIANVLGIGRRRPENSQDDDKS